MARSQDPHREHYWRQHHLRQRTSGLSIGDYCTRECISAAAFYAWRKRLAPSLPALPEPPLFVPVTLSSATGSAGTLPCHGIEIELSHYVRLRLDSLPEPEWLCRVTAGLTSLLSKEAIS
jgi:hypothetical protein